MKWLRALLIAAGLGLGGGLIYLGVENRQPLTEEERKELGVFVMYEGVGRGIVSDFQLGFGAFVLGMTLLGAKLSRVPIPEVSDRASLPKARVHVRSDHERRVS